MLSISYKIFEIQKKKKKKVFGKPTQNCPWQSLGSLIRTYAKDCIAELEIGLMWVCEIWDAVKLVETIADAAP